MAEQKAARMYKGFYLIPGEGTGWYVVNNYGRRLYNRQFPMTECKKKINSIVKVSKGK